jgi:hypothetical protein
MSIIDLSQYEKAQNAMHAFFPTLGNACVKKIFTNTFENAHCKAKEMKKDVKEEANDVGSESD